MPVIVTKRPSRLTDEFIEEYCDLLRKGSPIVVAAGLMKVSYNSIQSWLKSGEDPANPCHSFLVAVQEARAADAQEAIQQWKEINRETKDFRSVQNYLSVLHRIAAPSKVE